MTNDTRGTSGHMWNNINRSVFKSPYGCIYSFIRASFLNTLYNVFSSFRQLLTVKPKIKFKIFFCHNVFLSHYIQLDSYIQYPYNEGKLKIYLTRFIKKEKLWFAELFSCFEARKCKFYIFLHVQMLF